MPTTPPLPPPPNSPVPARLPPPPPPVPVPVAPPRGAVVAATLAWGLGGLGLGLTALVLVGGGLFSAAVIYDGTQCTSECWHGLIIVYMIGVSMVASLVGMVSLVLYGWGRRVLRRADAARAAATGHPR